MTTSKSFLREGAEDELPLSAASLAYARRFAFDVGRSDKTHLLGHIAEALASHAPRAWSALVAHGIVGKTDNRSDLCLLAQFEEDHGGVGLWLGSGGKGYVYGLRSDFLARRYDRIVFVMGG